MVIRKIAGKYHCRCVQCGRPKKYSRQRNAQLAIARGNCKNCFKRNKAKEIEQKIGGGVVSRGAGWAVKCPSCNLPRFFKRLDHARGTFLSGRNCRKCTNWKFQSGRDLYVENIRIAIFNKFKRSAIDRGLSWQLDISHFISLWTSQGGRCALSGIKLKDEKMKETYSLDRIDSSAGYYPENVQFVHKTINMMKGSLKDGEFRSWCRKVAKCRTNSV